MSLKPLSSAAGLAQLSTRRVFVFCGVQLFDTIDTDGGGTLDKAELGTALAKMNKPRSEV